ncbi:MAG: 23S rRNA (uracil(1939)-C(5))-methyltransferase RlmD [Pseudomonadota bacterium]|nr:23S rRNA (uracil(1939)-C(5))-methyltransferase RlmD [Pseudomonadota bacterium]
MTRRSAPRQLPVHELDIEGLSHEGRGVARHQGKVVFVDGALPGERVRAQVTRRRRGLLEARADAVLQGSPERVEPPCVHSDRCGGCSLQHWDPQAQIRWKQQVLADQLDHFGGLQPDTWLPPLVGPTEGYRQKARLGVRWVAKKNTTLVGFRERGSSFITELERCAVLVPAVGGRLMELRALINGLSVADQVPQIEVACGDTDVALVVRHLQPFSAEDLAQLQAFSRRLGWWLYLQPGGPDSLHRIQTGLEGEASEAQLVYRLPEFDTEIVAGPLDFTQVNPEINRAMVSQALSLLDVRRADRVLDLFCGLGNFTLPLARRAGQAIGAEADAVMVARAQANADRQGIAARFYTADLFSPEWVQADWVGSQVTAVLLDPPRSGAQAVVEGIGALPALERLVYVSCNPATFARDAGILAARGFRLRQAGVMDMFPHTRHVESMGLFERAAG